MEHRSTVEKRAQVSLSVIAAFESNTAFSEKAVVEEVPQIGYAKDVF